MERNLIVTPGRGLELTNEVGGTILNNTIVSTDGGDYGIKVSNFLHRDSEQHCSGL